MFSIEKKRKCGKSLGEEQPSLIVSTFVFDVFINSRTWHGYPNEDYIYKRCGGRVGENSTIHKGAIQKKQYFGEYFGNSTKFCKKRKMVEMQLPN